MDLPRLPTELQCAVIRYLDPVTLISISQTNKHFRRLVNPSERHFIERLLAYEILPEYGGISPFFDPWDNSLAPPCDDPAWSTMRLACPRCRRLLNHTHFDNHSILKLAYRKPASIASVHELPLTSWESSISLVYPGKAEKEKARLRDKELRRRYFLCVTDGQSNLVQIDDGEGNVDYIWELDAINLSVLQDCGMEGFDDMTEDEFNDVWDNDIWNLLERNARAIERERAGYKRLQRRCNECRYELGRIPPILPYIRGNDKMPIVACRQLPYGLHIDRWFPGFSDLLENKRPGFNPVRLRTNGDKVRSQPITTFMARCQRCARWQELRNFRIGGGYKNWKPFFAADGIEGIEMWDGREMSRELVREQHCNACFAEARGREELGATLARWVQYLVDRELPLATRSLLACFAPWRKMVGWLPETYQDEAKTIMRNTPGLREDRSSYRVTYSDVVMLRHCRSQWRDMVRRLRKEEGKEGEGEAVPDEWWVDEAGGAEEQWGWMMGCMDPTEREAGSEIRQVDLWHSETETQFGEAETMGRWLFRVRAEVEERPEVLVEWALGSSNSL